MTNQRFLRNSCLAIAMAGTFAGCNPDSPAPLPEPSKPTAPARDPGPVPDMEPVQSTNPDGDRHDEDEMPPGTWAAPDPEPEPEPTGEDQGKP